MQNKSPEALSLPATYSARATSVRCVTPELRRNRSASLLGLQAVALPDMPLSGTCTIKHGVLANVHRSMRLERGR